MTVSTLVFSLYLPTWVDYIVIVKRLENTTWTGKKFQFQRSQGLLLRQDQIRMLTLCILLIKKVFKHVFGAWLEREAFGKINLESVSRSASIAKRVEKKQQRHSSRIRNLHILYFWWFQKIGTRVDWNHGNWKILTFHSLLLFIYLFVHSCMSTRTCVHVCVLMNVTL